jgi:collagenase-like PrtC family protease
VHCLLGDMPSLAKTGVDIVRLSPQSQHMPQVIGLFDAVRRGTSSPGAAHASIQELLPDAPCNGYWHGRSGLEQVTEAIA